MAEKRLIDANDLWKKTFCCDEVAGVREFIEKAPTVDAVEVVRCKDCKNWKRLDHLGCTDFVKVCMLSNYMVGATGFCVYGERRTNEMPTLQRE